MEITTRKITNTFNGKTITQIRYDMNKQVSNRNLLAAKGYMLIFKFREYLLSESINYRYYFIDDSGVQIRNFSDKQLLDFMTFQESRIGLNSTNLIKSEDLKEKTSFTKMVNSYIKQYTIPDKNDYMQMIGYLNLRTVRKAIKMKYKNNRGLGKSFDNRRYQTFNMGHIFESVDLSLTYWLMRKDERLNVDDLMFGQFLKRDNIIASKGGDNYLTQTSIKSGNASIYSYNTVSNQLSQIWMLLKNKNPQTIKDQIKKIFLDDSSKSNMVYQDLEDKASKATDKLLSDIEKSLLKT